MTTINDLKPEQLKSPDAFKKVKELADSFVLHVQEKEAYLLQEKLTALLGSSSLKNTEPDLYKNYQNIIAQLKWAAFSLLADEDAMEVLKKNYLMSFDNEDVNTLDRIEAKMFAKSFIPRNELRQMMQRALKENEERLGGRSFGEWLLDYSRTFDFRDRDELSPPKYINQSSEAQALSKTEKNKLRKGLRLFDQTLLATPIMSEPLFTMAVKEMVKAGIIKEEISPQLLKSFSPTIEVAGAPEKSATKITEPEKKPEKKGLFKKLFKKKPKPEENLEPELVPPISTSMKEEAPPIYKDKLSPYEKERETTSAKPIDIPTFSKKTEGIGEIKPIEEIKEVKKEITKPKISLPKKQEIKEEEFKIRTMKGDIEKAKGKSPSKPEPMPTDRQAKVKNNIVDLSGK